MSINEGLWSAKLPNGDVRSGTLEQLNEAFRAGHLGESTLVCAAGSANWIKLADVLGSAAAFVTPPAGVARASAPPAQPATASVPPRANGGADLWQVRLAGGELRTGTRQQLEEAVRAGHLDDNAQALAPGSRDWIRIGTLLGRSQPPAAAVTQPIYPPASVAPQRPPSVAPPSVAPPATTLRPDGSEEMWKVRLANGEVRSGTRQQLEEAFLAGHLDGGAFALAAGATEWVRLGELMGRRPAAAVPAPAAAPQPAPPAAVEPSPIVAVDAAPVVTAERAPLPPPEPVIPAEPAPLVAQEVSPAEAAAEAPPDASEWEAASNGPASEAAQVEGAVWQVKLTFKQLEEAFHAGLLDDDTQVLAAGSDEWVPLGTIRREQPPPFGSAMPHAASPQEPASSRTEPWPATMPGNALSSTGE